MIRRTSNCALIEKLDKKCFPYDETVETHNCFWWVCYIDEEPAGYAGMWYEGKTAIFYRAGVLKKYQGRSIHKKLIKTRLRKAKKDGIIEVKTYTSYSNVISANNLIKCGFLLYEPKWDWGLPHALYFRNRLKR